MLVMQKKKKKKMKVYNYLQQQILEIRYVLTVKLH